MKERPGWMPQARQFSQADPHVVQRPDGLDAIGTEGIQPRDVREGRIERYSPLQVSPGRFDDGYAFTNAPQGNAGGEVVLFEKDLDFIANTFLVDNWTNQWLWATHARAG